MRALVVEDDLSIRDMLERFLESVAQCDLAEDGTVALGRFEEALARGQPYDLVCLDLVMPHMDGWEALRRLRAIEDRRGVAPTARAKVLIVTARDSSQNIRQFLTGSVHEAFLLKPFRKSDLLELIRGFGL